MFKTKKKPLLLSAVLVLGLLLSSCASGQNANSTTETAAPLLMEASIETDKAAAEEEQAVRVLLQFDRDIRVHPDQTDSLRVTIAGEREKEFTIENGESGNTAVVTIPTDAVTKGVVHIERSETANAIAAITGETGTPAADFSLDGTTPSGVSLSVVSAEPGKTVKSVDSAWNLRSIAWIGLYENGMLVQPQETRDGELLDGYVAVHGHEFLMEREADIADKMVETLEGNFDAAYHFDCEDNQITIEKEHSDAVLDLCLYQYVEINGEKNDLTNILSGFDAEQTTLTETPEEGTDEAEHEHEEGAKIKLSQTDRTPTAEEETLLARLESAKMTGEAGQDGTSLYRTFTITGDAMPETQIYSHYDLDQLVQLSYTNSAMYDLGLPYENNGFFGLRLKLFLQLCGADLSGREVHLTITSGEGRESTFSAEEFLDGITEPLLALAGPEMEGQELCILHFDADGTPEIYPVSRLLIGHENPPEDPQYGFHNRDIYLESRDITFTVEVYQQGADYLGATNTLTLTTEDLEDLMQSQPEQVRTGYYGTIGNEKEFPYVGVGGWLDHFEGLDMYWLLTEKLGLENWNGRAELYDRDGVCFSEIEDLSYFDISDRNAEDYYVMSAQGLKITGTVPMIGVIKNGAPILKNHTHDGPGYLAYNTLNQNLEAKGIATEVGVIKNHNGPFIACFGNADGYYGGSEVETGNNCVLMKIYQS